MFYRWVNIHWEYDVLADYTPDGCGDCGKAAVAYVWWQEDQRDKMYVCAKHIHMIEMSEAEDEILDGRT